MEIMLRTQSNHGFFPTPQEFLSRSFNAPRFLLLFALTLLTPIMSGAADTSGSKVSGTKSNATKSSATKSQVKTLAPLTGNELLALIRDGSAKATVVNVWATFCPPCLEEMPEIIAFKKEFENRGVKLILISADGPEDEASALRFLKRVKVDFPSYRMGEASEKFVAAVDPTWESTLPATFLYDAQGKQVRFWTGRINLNELEGSVNAVLAGKPLPDKGKTASDGKPQKGTK